MALARNKRSPRAARANMKLHPEANEKMGTDFDLTNPLVPEDIGKSGTVTLAYSATPRSQAARLVATPFPRTFPVILCLLP